MIKLKFLFLLTVLFALILAGCTGNPVTQSAGNTSGTLSSESDTVGGSKQTESGSNIQTTTVTTKQTVTTSPPAVKVFYGDYAKIAAIPDQQSCTNAQGFTTDGEYCYSAKIKSDETRAIIYRTEIATGETTIMKNGDNGTFFIEGLGHANDLAFVALDGKKYIFAAAMKTGEKSLPMLEIIGDTYYLCGSFTIYMNGALKSVSALDVVGVDDEKIYFLFKVGVNFYNGSVPRNAYSGSVTITQAFTVILSGKLSNGETVSDISSYTHQSFLFSKEYNRIYVPLYKGNKSIILVYNNILNNVSTSRFADQDISFFFVSNEYSLFEVEGCIIAPDGSMFFNTNLNGGADAIFVINEFIE